MRRATWACALILAGIIALRLQSDTSWVGDWNETGWVLMGSGTMGATLAGLLLAILASRDLAPLGSLGMRPSLPRIIVYVIRAHWQPMLAAWCLVIAVAYAITTGTNPSPSVASPWPVIAASSVVLCVMCVSTACGCLLRPAFAVPVTFLICYVIPVSVAWVDADHDANGFTPYVSLHLSLPSMVNASHYALKTAFFCSISFLFIASILSKLIGKSPLPALLTGIILALVIAVPLRSDNEQILLIQEPIHDMECEDLQISGQTRTICVLTDHHRYLPVLGNTVSEISHTIPTSTMPRAYIEDGLAVPEGLSASTVSYFSADMTRIDPHAAIVEATGRWDVCTKGISGIELVFARLDWLNYRLGRLEREIAEQTVGEGYFENNDEAHQQQWWREPMGVPCSLP